MNSLNVVKQKLRSALPAGATLPRPAPPAAPPRRTAPTCQAAQRINASATEATPASSTRRSAVGSLLGAVLVAAGSAALPLAAVAAAAPAADARKERERLMGVIDEYLNSFEKLGKDSKALESFRQKAGFRRGADGRVALRNSKGEFFTIKLDMEEPGAVLLRDANGYVYALQAGDIKQIDLSDDFVVLLLFGGGEWEGQIEPVLYQDDNGKEKTLQMTEREFREALTVFGPEEAEQGGGKGGKGGKKK